MRKSMSMLLCVVFLFGMVGGVGAAVIDFDDYVSGTNVSTIGDVTFSLAGVGEMGDPMVQGVAGNNYLWNSTDGATYPTNTILQADFTAPTTILNFEFNPYGLHNPESQVWSLFGISDNLIASGKFLGLLNVYDLSMYDNVAYIQWNNGGNNWLQGLASIEYDSAPVPEPSTWLLLGTGLAGLAYYRRKKS